MNNEDIVKELSEINDLAWNIQGRLNLIDETLVKISGNLLHNLQNRIYLLEDKLREEIVIAEDQQIIENYCYDD
jgi:hypothetical protein